MRVGIDDTDSPQGGCTTHFALEAAAAFRREHGLVLCSLPGLVRLNPNIPWKTRGNAAVVLHFGKPDGASAEVVGVAPDGTPLILDPTAEPVAAEPKHLATLERLRGLLCDERAPGTDPAFVLSKGRLPAVFYEAAVKRVVAPEDVRRSLKAHDGVLFAAHGDGRGIVGASAAIAYPAQEPTFEIIVYREPSRWGKPRGVEFGSVDTMDRLYASTYHNIDRVNRHIAIAPSTPCPLLFGIRAVSRDELRDAAASVDAGEPWGGWLLFQTNQGTDAHVVDSTVARAQPLMTVSVEGHVSTRPSRLRGGHVVFALSDAAGAALECAAYEPTKQFRDVVESLAPGDRVRAVGAIRDDRRTLNLEKLQIIAAAPRTGASLNPKCSACGTTMKSGGRRAPLRCRKCGAKQPKVVAAVPETGPAPGWYEVPIVARRHLAKPLDPHGYPRA